MLLDDIRCATASQLSAHRKRCQDFRNLSEHSRKQPNDRHRRLPAKTRNDHLFRPPRRSCRLGYFPNVRDEQPNERIQNSILQRQNGNTISVDLQIDR
jgi:hypothetical protein